MLRSEPARYETPEKKQHPELLIHMLSCYHQFIPGYIAYTSLSPPFLYIHNPCSQSQRSFPTFPRRAWGL
jgi:hypothetical protein